MWLESWSREDAVHRLPCNYNIYRIHNLQSSFAYIIVPPPPNTLTPTTHTYIYTHPKPKVVVIVFMFQVPKVEGQDWRMPVAVLY